MEVEDEMSAVRDEDAVGCVEAFLLDVSELVKERGHVDNDA